MSRTRAYDARAWEQLSRGASAAVAMCDDLLAEIAGILRGPPPPAPLGTTLCSRCNHHHGGKAFGLCLEWDCDCIEPRREPPAGVASLTVQDWPRQFPTREAWLAWCERDRADEDFEMTWGNIR